MKLLLDAGHGGKDPGAVAADSVREKDIALEVVLQLGGLLREMGIQVLYTRDRDEYISPSDRLRMIQGYKPEGFVSVHCNAAANPAAHGIETIWRDDYDYPLAAAIHQALIAGTDLADRGLKQDGSPEYFRNLAVLKDLEVPACLTEIGFISNAGDEQVIENTTLIAQAIYMGVLAWDR